MSTKTSIKRIALVAVAALGFGMVSTVSSSANQDLSNISLVSANTTGTVGTAVNATVNFNFVAYGDLIGIAGAAFYGAPATSSLSTPNEDLVWSALSDTSTAVNNSGAVTYQNYTNASTEGNWANYTVGLQSTATAAGRSSAYYKLTFTPDKAGTYLVRIFGYPNATKDAIYVDWTVVVSDPTPSAISSTGYALSTDSNTSGDYTLANDMTGYLTAPKAAGNLAGAIAVVQSNGSITNPLTAGGKLTVTVTGSGLVQLTAIGSSCNAASAVRAVTGTSTSLTQKICFFSDGTAGSGTVTWSTGTNVLGSSSAVFYGAAASYTATVSKSVIAVGSTSGAATTTSVSDANYRAVYVTVKDANGNIVPGATVYMNSSDTTVISGSYQSSTSGSTGKAYFSLTGVSAGTAKLSFTNKSSATDASITASNPEITAGPVEVRVGSTKPDSIKVSFNESSYNPGEKAIISVVVLDSKGNPVPRGKYSVFNSALSGNYALAAGSTPGTAVATASCADAYGVPGTAAATCAAGYTQTVPVLAAGEVWIPGNDGTATFAVNMPVTPATYTLSGTISTYLPNGLGTSANAGTAISASATVNDPNSAATDAANEATDAANAATDAANAAAEAADAATAAAQDAQAAVAELATQVASLIAGIKAQITTLTNLVIKIQKKVKA